MSEGGAREAGPRGAGRHVDEGEREQAQGDELRPDAPGGEGAPEEARSLRHFLLRGLEKVRGEWALLMTTHNVLKLYGAGLR